MRWVAHRDTARSVRMAQIGRRRAAQGQALMIVLCAFLAGISFVIAVAACVAAHRASQRAADCERALGEQAELITKLAQGDIELDAMIRAVASASVPPTITVDQPRVLWPGPRTSQ